MTRWTYRRRSGWQIGPWVIGYERRDYRITVTPFLAWPTIWRDKPQPPLAPAPQIDPEAFERRKQRSTQCPPRPNPNR